MSEIRPGFETSFEGLDNFNHNKTNNLIKYAQISPVAFQTSSAKLKNKPISMKILVKNPILGQKLEGRSYCPPPQYLRVGKYLGT